MHDLVDGIVQRHVVHVGEVEEHDVGLPPGLDGPDLIVEPEHTGAPAGGHAEDLLRRQPAFVVEFLHPRDHGCDPHRLEHVEVVGAGAGVGADADADSGVEQGACGGEAVSEPRVGAGVVGDRRPGVGEAVHVVAVEPHRVRGGEARAEHPERIEPCGLGPAVEPDSGEGLDLRLGEVDVEARLVFGGGPIRGPQERLAAVMGNRRGEREAHVVVGERPGRAGLLPSGHAGLEGFQRHRFRLVPQAGRQCVQEARDGAMEGAIGHHRSHHRTHSGVGVGLADRLQAFRGRGRELEAQVVGGGTSLAHHLHRTDEGGEVLVLERAPPGDPGRRVEQQLQGPAVSDALGEVVVAVGVCIDESRHEQPTGCVERSRVGGRGHARRADFADRIPFDQDVGRFRRVPLDVEQASTPDDPVHGFTSPPADVFQAARRPPR